jgi:hypothetical protein
VPRNDACGAFSEKRCLVSERRLFFSHDLGGYAAKGYRPRLPNSELFNF